MNRLLKHRFLLLVALLVPMLLLGSCRRDRTVKPLSQLKREQRQAIDRLVRTEGLRVIERNSETLPENPDTKVFYHLSNGVYLRVIQRGGQRPVADQTIVSVSLRGYYFNKDVSRGATFDNLSDPSYSPLEFRYISRYSVEGTIHYDPIASQGTFRNYSSLLCEGIAFPMSVLGDGAEVELIVPFEVGPSNNYTDGNSLRIERAIYQFYQKPQQ